MTNVERVEEYIGSKMNTEHGRLTAENTPELVAITSMNESINSAFDGVFSIYLDENVSTKKIGAPEQ